MTKKVTKGETKAQAAKRAKDAEFIAKGKTAVTQAKVMKASVEAAKSADILRMVDPGKDNGPTAEVKPSRYIRPEGEFGMGIKAGTEDRKPQEQEYVPEPAHISMAASFSDGKEDAILATIGELKQNLGVTQGKLAAACAGIAARLQIQREGALPILNAFIDACQPWGKQLTMVRSQDVIRWFTLMSCVDYEKSETKGEGKVFSINNEKHKKEGARFGRDKDAWIASKIARPFWLVKPETELGEFNLIEELAKLYERAAKLDKKKANPEKAGFKVLNLDGLTTFGIALNRLRKEAATQRAQEAAHGTTEDDTTADAEAA